MILHHITLQTSQTTTHRIDTLDPGAVAACRALLPHGGAVPGFPAFRVTVSRDPDGSAAFTISRGRDPRRGCMRKSSP